MIVGFSIRGKRLKEKLGEQSEKRARQNVFQQVENANEPKHGGKRAEKKTRQKAREKGGHLRKVSGRIYVKGGHPGEGAGKRNEGRMRAYSTQAMGKKMTVKSRYKRRGASMHKYKKGLWCVHWEKRVEVQEKKQKIGCARYGRRV